MVIEFKQPNPLSYAIPVAALETDSNEFTIVEVVDLDLKLIDTLLKENPASYVGVEGEDFQPSKHKRVSALLDSGSPIDMPVLFAACWHDPGSFRASVRVADGRHRIYALYRRNVDRVKVVVPFSQAKQFVALFG